MTTTPVFVWREGVPPSHNMQGLCLYCSAKTKAREITDPNDTEMDPELREHWRTSYDIPPDAEGYGFGACYRSTCPRCGWWINYGAYNTGAQRTLNAALRIFDINGTEAACRRSVRTSLGSFLIFTLYHHVALKRSLGKSIDRWGGKLYLPRRPETEGLIFFASGMSLAKPVSWSASDMHMIAG